MSCCDDGDDVLILAGDGIAVTGSGSPTNPYRIASALPDFSSILTVRDTDTVNLILTGSGTPDSPLVLRADSSLKLTALADVDDPDGGPAVGESPVWVGVGAAGHWEFKIPSVAPAGAVNVSNGIGGTGASATPIKLLTSGTWGSGSLAGLGSDSTIGQAVYIDSAGNVRAQPAVTSAPAWASITGKPSVFPTNAANISDPLNINAGKINGAKITTAQTSTPTPTSPTIGDLFFFPKGS